MRKPMSPLRAWAPRGLNGLSDITASSTPICNHDGRAAGLKSDWRPGEVLVATKYGIVPQSREYFDSDPKLLGIAAECWRQIRCPTFRLLHESFEPWREKIDLG